MQDTNLMLRASGDGNLTTSETGSAVDHGVGGARKAFTIKAVFPAAGGTNPTCDLTIEESDTEAFDVVQRQHVLAQITDAGVYRVSIRPKYQYLRYKNTVGGTSPDFGAVEIGAEAQGSYDQF